MLKKENKVLNKLKKFIVSLCLVACAVCVSLCFAGCRPKIDNADIQKVLPGATGTYETITFEIDELKPEGFVAAYKVNSNVIVTKSQNVWGSANDEVYIYSAIRGGKYLNIVAEKTQTRTQNSETDADFNALVNELNALKNKDVKFVFNDSDVDKVHGYNYPKTINCHYNVYKYLQVNPSVNKLDEYASFVEQQEIAPLVSNGNGGQTTPGYKTPHIVTYTSQILSHDSVNGEDCIIVKTIPVNDEYAAYSPYCFVTMYVCFSEGGALKNVDLLEVYCSPNESCYHTESEFKTILGLTDFIGEHSEHAFISGGTITAGASWFGLKAAKEYINNK